MIKKGYFIGNCLMISFKLDNERYEYKVFDKSIKYVDPLYDIEITDENTKLAYFKKRELNDVYNEIEESVIIKAKEMFASDNLDFVEVSE